MRFRVEPSDVSEVVDETAEDDRVETVFASADGTVTLVATADPSEAGELTERFDARGYEIDVVVEERHAPAVAAPSFEPDCVECGNTVDEEGVSTRVAGELYHFCCTSCESAFRERYEAMG